MKKRIMSLLLSLVLVASVFTCLSSATTTKAHAATKSQLNMVARADYMYNSTWTCKANVSGWRYRYTFYKGNTYRLPYAWPVSAGAYIGYGISVAKFLQATKNASSSFYTRKSYLSGSSSTSTYYGNDCSAFVSYCWGIGRNTTYTIPNRSRYIGRVSTSNATYTLQLGDALNSNSVGHVVLVTGLSYNSNGSIRQIEITEQTPPQLKRSYYTPSSLANKYYSNYYIYRYGGSVPASPGGNTVSNSSSSSSSSSSKGLTISPKSLSMNVDTFKYINENSSQTVTWSSSNTSVATVTRHSSAQGKVTAKKAGTAVITATTSSGTKATCTVKVYSSEYYPRCSDSYNSIVDALKSVGVSNPNHTLRTQIAEANGITGYSGTAEQNIKMLKLLKLGKLIRPDSYSHASSGKYYQACASYHQSLIDALKSIGAIPDIATAKLWDYQLKIAAANNVANYRGTYNQNVYLLGLLKKGKLIVPLGMETSGGSSSSSGSGGSSSGGSSSGGSSSSSSSGNTKNYNYKMAGTGKILAHGLDVSSWQGSSLDFNRIKKAGYSYVILRCGTSKGKDTCFETYYSRAKAAGLNVGTYYYSYATNTSAAATDAANCLSWIKGKKFEYPVYFDFENSTQGSLSSSTKSAICYKFINKVKSAGYLAGMYSMASWMTASWVTNAGLREDVEGWVAHYPNSGSYTTYNSKYCYNYGMYQYTSKKYIGNYGPYDANVCYKDYPSIVKKYGFNGY